jgi:F-type H+-transporting ATPase subunit b
MEGLGIDFKILAGDIITFVVLVVILKKYAFKPFLAVLESRRQKIEEGVKKTDEAEKTLQKIRLQADEVREAGERKTREIVQLAEKKAQAKAVLAAAEEEKVKVVANAKAAMEKEQTQARERRQQEALDLALAVSEKFLAEKITKDQDKKMIERLVSELN